MEPVSLVLVAAVVGVVEFLKRLKLQDYWAAVTILAAAVVGVLAAVFNAPGVPDVWTGLVMGLGASGLVTTATRVG